MTNLAGTELPGASSPNDRPPILKRIPTTMTLHGDTRTDEYAWLHERSNPEVAAYLEAENAYTKSMTAPTVPLQGQLYEEMLGHVKQTDLGAPYRQRGYLYYSRTQEGQQYAMYCRRRGNAEAPEEIVLDLNAVAVGKTYVGLGAFVVSDDGNLLAYAIDETGYRQYTLRVKDLRTGATLGERLERVTSVVWARDDRTLLYATEDRITKRADSVWRHALGTAADADVLVYHEADELFDTDVERTRDGAFVFIRSEAKDTSDVRYIAADRPAEPPKLFAQRRDGIRYILDEREQQFHILTNEDAPDFRVFTTPVTLPERANWTELVGQRAGITITGIELFAGFVAIVGRRDGRASIELFIGNPARLVPLEFEETDYTVRIGQNAEYDTTTLRYRYESLVTPASIYDLDVASGDRTLVKRTDVPGYDPAGYRAERVFIAAGDGTKIPVSIVRRRDVPCDGTAPMLLRAYGSYGVSLDPTFSASRLALLDRGVMFGIAHVRGGGEYGEAWRLAGNLFQKRTSFTDFIDSSVGLVDAAYTSPDRLVIEGGSAGGLLVAAACNMRPDLFRAAIARVPFVDVLTTMLDSSLPLTTGEYREWGNPNEQAAYDYMRTYSPVDNVTAQPYPAMLIEVSFNDSQVPYWEGVKLAAKLRACTTSVNPILVKANMDAGHGGSSGRYDALREQAFDVAFVLSQVGVGSKRAAAPAAALP